MKTLPALGSALEPPPRCTCVGDHEPPPQEVEGAIGHVVGAAGQGAEVALCGEPGHEVSTLGGGRAVVQCVPSSTQRAQQVPIGQLELGRAVLAWAERALVGHGGGAEVWLDGEQAGVVCSTEQATVVPGQRGNRGFPAMVHGHSLRGHGAHNLCPIGHSHHPWRTDPLWHRALTPQSGTLRRRVPVPRSGYPIRLRINSRPGTPQGTDPHL